jgi:hypothetical protein
MLTNNRGSRGEISEHVVIILASIVLCAGGVYYWHHRKTEWVVNPHPTNQFDTSESHTRFVASAWTPEDTQQFKECVKEHLLEWRHYANGPGALLGQLGEVVTGKVCSSKLPPLDQSQRMRLVTADGFLKPGECNQLRTEFRSTKAPTVIPDWGVKPLKLDQPTALSSCILSRSDVKDWNDWSKRQLEGSATPLPPPASWHARTWHATTNARDENYY